MALIAGLLLFGIIMVFDASAVIAADRFGNQFRFVMLHIIWIVIGFGALLFFYFFDYHIISKLTLPIIIVTILSLILVLFIGNEINGSTRWFEIESLNLSIQPSELAKIGFIIYLATWLTKEREFKTKSFTANAKKHITQNMAAFLLILATVCFLIILQPDLGTTIVIAGTSLAIYFISSSGFLHNIGSISIVALFVLMAGFAAILSPYRFERVLTHTQFLATGNFTEASDRDYQLKQVLTAVGSGGLTGVGFGESKQKYFYLVDLTAFTDSVFAVYAEEFGFIGSILLISVFIYFAYLGVGIAKNAPDKLGFLLASGVTIWITLQAFMHIGANSAVIPITGLTLPFVSYGGSSMLVTMAGIGILLNVSRQIDLKK